MKNLIFIIFCFINLPASATNFDFNFKYLDAVSQHLMKIAAEYRPVIKVNSAQALTAVNSQELLIKKSAEIK